MAGVCATEHNGQNSVDLTKLTCSLWNERKLLPSMSFMRSFPKRRTVQVNPLGNTGYFASRLGFAVMRLLQTSIGDTDYCSLLASWGCLVVCHPDI